MWTSLPAWLLEIVFGNLAPLEFFFRCRAVCAAWNKSLVAWSTLSLQPAISTPALVRQVLRINRNAGMRNLTLPQLFVKCTKELLQTWPRLRSLQLLSSSFDVALRHAPATLEKLELYVCHVLHRDHVAVLSTLRQLKVLRLNTIQYKMAFHDDITGRELGVCLSHLCNLEVLELHGASDLQDGTLEVLPALHNLQRLELDSCTGLSDSALSCLANCPKLERLDLAHCRQLKFFSRLASSKSLRSLNLTSTEIKNSELVPLLHSLQELNVSFCFEVSDAAFKRLEKLPTLRMLRLARPVNMAGRRLTNRTLEALSTWSALESLDVQQCCNLTDDGLRHIQALPSLQELKSWPCNLSASPLPTSLRRLTWLRAPGAAFAPLVAVQELGRARGQ